MARVGVVAGAGVVGVMLACAGVGVVGQRNTQTIPAPMPDYSGQQSRSMGASNTRLTPFEDQTMRELENKRGKALASERQRMMAKEAEQMVQVAAEFEAGETAGMAREEQIRRAELIERLAKSVKERMKGSR